MEIKKRIKAQLTIIIRIRPKKMPKNIRIHRRIPSPHIPHLIAQRIGHELVLRTLHHIIRTHVRRLRIGIFGRVQFLGGEEAEVFAPEEAAEGGGVVAGFVGCAVHGAVDEVLVFHDDGEFAVVDAELGLR